MELVPSRPPRGPAPKACTPSATTDVVGSFGLVDVALLPGVGGYAADATSHGGMDKPKQVDFDDGSLTRKS